MKKDDDKSHLYITTAAALVMLIFCIIQGYELFHTALVVVITIVSFYVVFKTAIAIVKRVFFKPLPEEDEAEEKGDEADGDGEGEEDDDVEKYEMDDEVRD